MPHSHLTRAFSITKLLAVYPRLSTRATELVTPLTPMEGIATGKPIVASDVGGLSELLSGGETAKLFPAGSVSRLAEAICALLEDEDERHRFQMGARLLDGRGRGLGSEPLPSLPCRWDGRRC